MPISEDFPEQQVQLLILVVILMDVDCALCGLGWRAGPVH
jgi:hypothetical protein